MFIIFSAAFNLLVVESIGLAFDVNAKQTAATVNNFFIIFNFDKHTTIMLPYTISRDGWAKRLAYIHIASLQAGAG
jgi:hypothetical protein